MSLAVVDSTWPRHLAPLKEVDNLLRCGICFDYFNIAVIIPQCSHNYCSLCIRKSLSYKAQCPTCCLAATEPDLKNNRILDELVKTFSSTRQWLFQGVLALPPTLGTKKATAKGNTLSSPVDVALEKEKQFTDNFLVQESTQIPERPLQLLTMENKKSQIKQEENACDFEEDCEKVGEGTGSLSPMADTTILEMPSTSAAKVITKVECPVCGVAVQEQHINKHLDGCLARDEKKDSLRSSGHKRKFLPKVVYNLLSERELKKRLKEQGLSTHGSKQQLIKRHQEFVHMYNAQCDALNPKSVSEIVKELENNEKTRAQLESSKSGEDNMTFTKHQTENEIDAIHRNYRKKHKAEFQILIDQMNKQKKKTNKIKTDEEELEQENATTEDLPMELGKKLSVKEPTDCAFLPSQPLKMDSVDSGESQSLDLSEYTGLVSATSPKSSSSSSSDILRDLEIAGMCSDSSDKSSEKNSNIELRAFLNRFKYTICSFSDGKMSKRKSQATRSSPLFRSKRRKKTLAKI